MSKDKAPVQQLKTKNDSFDILDFTGTIGVRFTNQPAHIVMECRRYIDNGKRCDKREHFLPVIPKDMVPEIIDNLAKLSLTETLPISLKQIQVDDCFLDDSDGKKLSVIKTRIKNGQERSELIAFLKLMVEIGDNDDLASLMGALGRFLIKHETNNPGLVNDYLRMSDEMFPNVMDMAAQLHLMDVETKGNA